MENITYNGFFTLQWHITHRCNLRCSHCYQDDYSAFSSRKSLEAVLNQYSRLLEEYGFKGYLNITGGEPLAHADLFWLLEEAGNRGKAAEDRDVQGKGTGKERYISRWNVKW